MGGTITPVWVAQVGAVYPPGEKVRTYTEFLKEESAQIAQMIGLKG